MAKQASSFIKTTYVTIVIVISNCLLFLATSAGLLPTTTLASLPAAVLHGHWLPLLTAFWLHASWEHLALNMFTLLIIGPVAEHFYGHLRYTLIYLSAGIGGNLLACYLFALLASTRGGHWVELYTATYDLGSSIAIAGVIVASAVVLLPLNFPRRQLSRWWNVAAFVYAVIVLLPIGPTAMPGSTVLHIGGACVGLLWFIYGSRHYRRR
ncbi:rhomboid family intramembrane serine protease [Lacticaseibacillus zhaodongensis]|uniref:rhomboid family intramembrane serine protease n=1 Tax=Lacticaseibacillus zhaodongensis TaxID=2668065 RepID=UPI0018AF9752|nr:rhomboid family intramembrane serine protease [Lacticaseibacillus zhaodongensis]